MGKYFLHNRYTLLATVIAVYIIIIVIEGYLTDRQTRDYLLENPYIDLNIRSLEPTQDR